MLQKTPSQDADAVSRSRPKGYVIGVVGGVLAASIWGGWIVATRHAVTTELDPVSIGFIRFLVPAIIFMPFWLQVGMIPRTMRFWEFVLMIIGGGFGVHLLAAGGLQFAPVAEFGALAPGTIPLFVAGFAYFFWHEKFDRSRLVGLSCIVVGVLGIGGWSALTSTSGEWRGHLLFLLTACFWSLYTIMFKRANMSPFAAAGLIGLWSSIVLLPFAISFGIANIGNAPLEDVLLQTTVQGFLSSVVAIVGYGLAVQALGAARGAVFTCLVPAIATLLAIPILGEWPGWHGLAAIGMITIGVTLASGVVALPGRRPANSTGH